MMKPRAGSECGELYPSHDRHGDTIKLAQALGAPQHNPTPRASLEDSYHVGTISPRPYARRSPGNGLQDSISPRLKRPVEITAANVHIKRVANARRTVSTEASEDQAHLWPNRQISQGVEPGTGEVQSSTNSGPRMNLDSTPADSYSYASEKSTRDDAGVRDGQRRYHFSAGAMVGTPLHHRQTVSTSAR